MSLGVPFPNLLLMLKGKLSERLPRPPYKGQRPLWREHIRRDKGNAALIGVLIALALTGLMLSLAGPDMLDILRGARQQKMEANFQQAMTVVEARIQQDPQWLKLDANASSGAGADLAGKPHLLFLDTLIADGAEFTWLGTGTEGWDLQDTDDDTTIRVQFLRDGTTAVLGANLTGPQVPWLVSSGTAIRFQSRNEDGAWICALVVARPTVTDTEAREEDQYLEDAITFIGSAPVLGTNKVADSPTSAEVNSYTGRRVTAWLGGTWYDTGDSYTNSTNHCDPVGVDTAGNPEFYYPISGKRWIIGTNDTSSNISEIRDLARNLL